MRILTVTNMYPGPRKEVYGTFVREHVEAIKRQGLHADVFFTDARGQRAKYVTDLPRLARVLRRGRYDVVHAHHTYSVFQAILARTFTRSPVPILFTMHEGEVNVPPGYHESADLIKRLVYSKRLKHLALRLSDACVAVEARLPHTVGYMGQYSVIPPGVDTDLFRPLDRLACRRELGHDPHEAVLFFPADPARRLKGADVLERSIRLLESPVRIAFGGAIPHRLMPMHMNAADVVVQTSVYEASPTVVKEAMACNARVVSTDVGDVKQLFADTHGCFCASADEQSLATAIEAALRFRGRPEGRNRILALGLSLDSVGGRYVEEYVRLAAGAAGGDGHSRSPRRRQHVG